jgi:hypothetical protein
MACVVEGTAKVLDEISLLERIQITDEDIIWVSLDIKLNYA